MAARDMRYDWFEELRMEYGFTHVVLAHHADDNFETVLFNLTKGTGIRGLTGMKSRTENMIRPLLNFTKKDIIAYAQKTSLVWVEDYTNAESNYARNKIRNRVIPILKEINPSLLHTHQQTIERLAGVEEMTNERLNEIRSKHLKREGTTDVLNLDWISDKLGDQVLLGELLRNYDFQYAVSKQVFETIESTGKLFFSSTHVANKDRGNLLIRARRNEDFEMLVIGEKDLTISGLNFRLDLERIPAPDSFDKDYSVAFLDIARLNFPLVIRPWQEGDAFQPLGMSGRKKVSDFLIDEKVPLIEKEDVFVLESAGEICWLIGHRIDDRFKVTKKTKQVLRINHFRHSD